MAAEKKLHVDMSEVLFAMDSAGSYGAQFFLDLETGEVHFLSDGSFEIDEDPFAAELEAAPDRFEAIPRYGAREKYELMCRFTESVDEEDIQSMLVLALDGKGAFGRFRDVVCAYPDLEAAWRGMEQAALLEAAEAWFDSLEIEPVYEPLAPVAAPATEPEPRAAARPRIDLLDLLVLGAPEGKTELLKGRVLRRFTARTEGEARALFKSLARDLCGYFGLAWRKRHVQGKSSFDLERAHLSVEGTTVELAIDVPAETWRAFSGTCAT